MARRRERKGAVAARGLYQTMANIGQYIVPMIFTVGAVVSALGQRRRQALVLKVAESDSPAALGEMTWREFEGLVQEAFRLRGYSVRRVGGYGPDGGVDLTLDRGPEKVLVQCKQWRDMRVGVSVVRELYGVLAAQGAAAGIVVTSGSFTPDAIEFASGPNIRLIAGSVGLGLLSGLYAVAMILPSIAVTVRRLHDTDRSGWWYLLVFLPVIGGLVILVFMLLDGTPGSNRFGPSPKDGSGAGVVAPT